MPGHKALPSFYPRLIVAEELLKETREQNKKIQANQEYAEYDRTLLHLKSSRQSLKLVITK